jgi:tyrosine-protein kinase Etk/Wzc
VVAGIRDVISIFPTSKTVSTIELTISDPLPERGESILNTLLRIYDQMNKDDKNRIADSTIAFIDERLQIVASELGNVEGDIEKFRTQNKLTDISSQGKLLLDNSFAYLKELNQADVQIEVVNALENYLRNADNRARLVPTSLTLQDPTLVSMVQAYNAAQIEADRRAQNTAANNPVMQQLTVQINNLRDDILSTLGNLKRSLVITRDNLKRKSDQLYNQMSRIPGNEKLFLEFSRQQSIKQELYLYLLQKREETSVSKAANVDIVRIVDSGKSDTKPYFPRPSLIYILAVIVGLILPGVILFVRSLLNTRILSKADVIARTNTQVIAEIMHNENKEESRVVEPGSRTVISEQFRTLRTNLQYLLPGANDKCIMITSSMSAEGKSFVAMNLASAIELTGKRVVLLELDLRKPKISKMLELDHATGFTNYIINKSHIEDIIIPVEHGSGLFVVPSGPVPPNPSELLLSPKVNDFFDHLKLHFDYIIIDTAPVGLVSDAQLLARYADTTLYIVRHRYTFKQQITLVEDLRKRRKLPRMNIVINDIRSSRHLSYGYGYSSYGNEEYFKGSGAKKGRGKRIWV